MYTIELGFNKTLPAYPKEGQLYKRNPRLINVDYMITKSLDSIFKIIDPTLCNDSEKEVNYLVDLINQESKVEFQFLDLDVRGLWPTFDKAYKTVHAGEKSKVHIETIGDYLDACQKNNLGTNESNKINVNLVNICLVFKLLHPINKVLNNLNTIAMYCDLDIRQKYVYARSTIVPKLLIKRVELLELNHYLGDAKQLEIKINNEPNPDVEPEFLTDLRTITPIISFKKDSQLRQYLNYDKWTRFIFAIRDYYTDKKSKSSKDNQILYYINDDESFGFDDGINCYLLQLKGNANIVMSKNAKYFLINRNDESNNYRIHLTNLEDNASNNLIKKLDAVVQFYTNQNNDLQARNANDNQTIANLTNELNNLNETLNTQNKDLDAIKEQLNNYQVNLDSCQSSLHDLETNALSLTKRQKQLKNNQKSSDEDEEAINQQLEKIEKQIAFNKTEKIKIQQQIEPLLIKIKDLSKALNIQTNAIKLTKQSIDDATNHITSLNRKIKQALQQIEQNKLIINKYENQMGQLYFGMCHMNDNLKYDSKK